MVNRLGDFYLLLSYRQDNPSWNDSSLSAFNMVLDEFVKYDNTAAVFVGNEVLTFGMSTGSASELFLMY